VIETLLTSVFVALCAVALTVILRNAPVIRGWVMEMKKPWACNVCLPLYLCAAVVAALYVKHHSLDVLWAYLPGYALAYITLEAMARPPSAAPDFPELKE
jgi:hypothetical protein